MARIPAKDYHRIWRKRAQNILNSDQPDRIKAAAYTLARIRMRMPIASGNMRNSTRRIGTRIVVRGSNPVNKFPYVHWVNQTRGRGMTRLRFPTGNKRFGILPGTVAVYGKSPAHFRWTGQAKFVSKGVKEGREQFKRIKVRSLRRSLEVTA
jgi:hypothetical protein